MHTKHNALTTCKYTHLLRQVQYFTKKIRTKQLYRFDNCHEILSSIFLRTGTLSNRRTTHAGTMTQMQTTARVKRPGMQRYRPLNIFLKAMDTTLSGPIMTPSRRRSFLLLSDSLYSGVSTAPGNTAVTATP